MEDVRQIFYQDMQEKRVSASGARHKKGKKGRVGRMITPADVSGPEYRRVGETSSYNFTQLVGILSKSPALRDVLLARLDEEYRHYRTAIERTVEAVNQLLEAALGAVADELRQLERRVETCEASLLGVGGDGNRVSPKVTPVVESTPARPARRRLRWGQTPEEIKATSFHVLDGLQKAAPRITVGLIRARAPSMMRWLYGEKAVFDGLRGLLEEYQEHQSRVVGS